MKIQIEKTVLENAINKAQSFIGKDHSDVTSQIYMMAKNDELVIRSTTRDMGILASINNVVVIENGSSLVNGSKLTSSVKALKNGDIKIEVIADNLLVSQSKTKFKIPMFDSLEFPAFPVIEGMDKLTINSIDMVKSFKKVIPSIDVNSPKFELTGCLIEISKSDIKFVATDTKRLSIVEYENNNDNELLIIIPKKAILEIQKLFFDDVEMFYTSDIMVINSTNFSFFTKIINGKFPDYKRIIPESTDINLESKTNEFVESIKQISVVSEEVKISFSNDNIEFESLSNDKNKAKTSIENKDQVGETIALCVNGKFMLDFLASIDSDSFNIGINSSQTPFTLSSGNLNTIIMPIIE